MPNHVTNILSFSGDSAVVNEIMDRIKSVDKDGVADVVIDFNKFHPMPECLRDTISPMRDETKKLINKLLDMPETSVKVFVLEHFVDGTKDETVRCALAYLETGYESWYEWANKNWGTKWGAYDAEYLDDGAIQFQTAWSTPVPAMIHLSILYPEVTLHVRYADEDLGSNCGIYSIKDGQIIEDDDRNGDLEFACEVRGYDYDEVMADREEEYKEDTIGGTL